MSESDSPTIVKWHSASVERARGCVVWFTGLSGSGKSTVANRVDELLANLGTPSFVLDGDNVRHGLNATPQILAQRHSTEFAERFGLTFSSIDREENIRRIACVAELFVAAGLVTLTAFVSPFRRDRDLARQLVVERGGVEDFVEVFVDTPIEICETRDPKGLYKKARAGEIKNFTGISDPYESPNHPELHLAGGSKSIDELANEVVDYLRKIKKVF